MEFNILLSVKIEKTSKNTDNSPDYLLIIASETDNLSSELMCKNHKLYASVSEFNEANSKGC